MRGRIFLSGPIYQCRDEDCMDWRRRAAGILSDFECIDPMERDYRGQTALLYSQIVEEDKKLISTCHALLVNFTGPSVGTAMEMLYAWERNIHVVTVTSDFQNPWLIYHSHRLSKTLEEATSYLQKRFSPKR